jgi:hypothetical protein
MPSTLELLDKYIDDIDHERYSNIAESNARSFPIITGSLFVNNTATTKLSEAQLFNRYSVYFPGLDIKAAYVDNAYRARFVTYENGVENELNV